MEGDADLFEVGNAPGPIALFFGPRQGWQQQRREDGDDGNDDQQLTSARTSNREKGHLSPKGGEGRRFVGCWEQSAALGRGILSPGPSAPKAAQSIEIAQQGPAALQQLTAAQVHSILATLYSEQQTELGGDLAPAVLRSAQARMRDEFASDLDLEELARELNVSYSWFRHAFVQQTGFSPHQYLVELRLANARTLLVQSSLKIKEIAVQSGFPDEHYFSRIFKTKAGLTAHEWRRRAQGNGAGHRA